MSVRIAVPVTASIGDEVRVQYALLPPGGAEPSMGSKLWALAASAPTADLPTTLRTPPLITPSRVWIRLSSWEGGRRVSNYTTPESFELAAVPALSSVLLTVDDGGGIVTWEPGAFAEEVRIRWAVESDPDASPSWSSPVDVDAQPAAFAVPQLPAMGERVWVELTPMLGSGGTLGTVVVRSGMRPIDYGTMTCPKNWVFTSDGVPVRTTDFCVVTTDGTDIPEDWVLTSDGVPVRTTDLEIVRIET